MTSARLYFFALVITAAAMSSRNTAAHEGSPSFPQRDSGPPTASSRPSIVCAPALRSLANQPQIRAALIDGMVKFFRDSQIDSDRLREFLRDPLAAQINWNSGADLNSHAQAIALFQTFARNLPSAEQSHFITELTAALQAILAERETSQTIARESLEQTAEIPLVKVFNAGLPINYVAFSQDGKLVVAVSGRGTIRLWDAQTNKELRTFQETMSEIVSVAFSSSGEQILTVHGNGTAKQWCIHTGRAFRPARDDYRRWANDVAFSPDGKLILTGSKEYTASLWEAQTGLVYKTFRGHSGPITSVKFFPDGRHILTHSEDQGAKVWVIQTAKERQSFCWPMNKNIVIAISHNSRQVIKVSPGSSTAELWGIQEAQKLKTFEEQGHIRTVAFSPDDTIVLTGSFDGTARLWNTETGRELQTFRGHNNCVVTSAFSPDGKSILTGSRDGTARLWPLPPQFWPCAQSTKAAAP